MEMCSNVSNRKDVPERSLPFKEFVEGKKEKQFIHFELFEARQLPFILPFRKGRIKGSLIIHATLPF